MLCSIYSLINAFGLEVLASMPLQIHALNHSEPCKDIRSSCMPAQKTADAPESCSER
jgi:hypothetical protein